VFLIVLRLLTEIIEIIFLVQFSTPPGAKPGGFYFILEWNSYD
jgi:hypothetical protein